jgi:FkbM family methyltransferase
MALKHALAQLLAFSGYEVRKKPDLSVHVPELAGLSFADFLHSCLAGKDVSKVFFIQIGANDGVSNDAIHESVVRFGLKGLLVEPQATSFRELTRAYRAHDGVILDNVAISHKDGTQKLYTVDCSLPFLRYANQLASFDYEHVRRQLKRHFNNGASPAVRQSLKDLRLTVDDCIRPELVTTCTFHTLLEKHGISAYELLQIDTEGFDYEVIKMALIERFRPLLVNYEHEHLKERDKVECWNYLRNQGYKLFTHEGNTAAYLVEKAWPRQQRNSAELIGATRQ